MCDARLGRQLAFVDLHRRVRSYMHPNAMRLQLELSTGRDLTECRRLTTPLLHSLSAVCCICGLPLSSVHPAAGNTDGSSDITYRPIYMTTTPRSTSPRSTLSHNTTTPRSSPRSTALLCCEDLLSSNDRVRFQTRFQDYITKPSHFPWSELGSPVGHTLSVD